MNQLYRAGVSIRYVGKLSFTNGREVYDIGIDRELPEEFFENLYSRLARSHNYFVVQTEVGEEVVLRLIPITRSGLKGGVMKIILALLTVFTVWLTGFAISSSYGRIILSTGASRVEINDTALSLVYTAAFILILLSHEAGHMIVSKRSGIAIEGPYLIPAPPLQLGFIGTLGAVINMKSLPPSRRRLAELGLSGPLIGLLVSIVIGLIGLHLSPLINVENLVKTGSSEMVREVGVAPLTIALLLNLREVPEGYVVLMHPLLFGSYVFMLVTFLNLLPVGQLDGGHVVRAYTSPRTHKSIGYLTPLLLLSVGVASIAINGVNQFASLYISVSLVLTILNLILGNREHLGSANQLSSMKSYVYIVIYLIALILTTPIPL